jgi:uncharacterized protein YfiM (DUF2279 family)
LVLLLITGSLSRVKGESYADSSMSDTVRADSWFGDDKIRHLAGSMMLTTFSAQVAKQRFNVSQKNAVIFGAGFSFSLGLAKETVDQTKPDNIFSWKDLIADIAGITLGVLLLNL